MRLTKKGMSDLAAMARQMETMAAEMNAVADRRVASAPVPSTPTVKAKPAQLQINQSGSWRSVLNFDAGDMPQEFLQAAEDLVRLSGADATMRLVLCSTGPNGGLVSTSTVLMYWSRKQGWANA